MAETAQRLFYACPTTRIFNMKICRAGLDFIPQEFIGL